MTGFKKSFQGPEKTYQLGRQYLHEVMFFLGGFFPFKQRQKLFGQKISSSEKFSRDD